MAVSAGILVVRRVDAEPQLLLAHPGGPLWSRRDQGAWTIPKGLVEPGEEPLQAALREFKEETGLKLQAPLTPLTPIRQAGGKLVMSWMAVADLDLTAFRGGEFEMEWPPRSGRRQRFPEIDRLRYFPAGEAATYILPSQAPLIAEAIAVLEASHD